MRPSYFDPTPQPDTETQYRQGGKVNKMQKLSVAKKMPRKFQAGGMTKPAVKPNKNPVKSGPPELVEAAKQLEQEKRDAATQKKGAEKPVLGDYKMAKGGSIRKFADGGETTAEDKDVSYEMPSEPATSRPRFGNDTYARAQRFLETGKKDDGVATKATYKPSPKNVSTVADAPKKESPRVSTPKKEAPRFTAEGDMNSNVRQEAPRKRGMYERGAGPMLPAPIDSGKQPSGPTMLEKARAKRLNDEAEARVAAAKNRKYVSAPATKAKDEYEGMSPSEASLARGEKFKKMLGLKKGGAVKKFAKGGMARGYGISKVTNKTKYC
jgi:hypothetical protein